MPPLPTLVTHALAASPVVKYALLGAGAVIEGPILFVFSGILLRIGAVSLVPLVVCLIIGDLAGDIVWYCVGRYVVRPRLKERERFFGVKRETIESTEGELTKYRNRLLLVSKATLGFGSSIATLPVLMTAGVLRVPFYTYLLLNLIGEVLLLAWMLGAGYLFGASILHLPSNARILIGAGVAIFCATLFLVMRKIRNRYI